MNIIMLSCVSGVRHLVVDRKNSKVESALTCHRMSLDRFVKNYVKFNPLKERNIYNGGRLIK